MKILTVVGARPQFIKSIAFSSLAAQHPGIEEILLHTGQHYDANMSDVFFRELGIPEPRYRLGIGGGSHARMTALQMMEIEKALISEEPDVCLVYGDTNSTLAGALAAAKLHVPVAHVEAGLRSFNKLMPEEINRILADHVSRWLFTPTETANRNLLREGFPASAIRLVGDVMYDVSKLAADRHTDILDRLDLTGQPYAVATVHRQENTDSPTRLKAILEGLSRMEVPVVLPLHPRTKLVTAETADPVTLGALAKLTTVPPLGYFDMATLVANACLVVTDSGGLQKEAYFHRVPCVTVRDETEWTELVEIGWNRLPEAMTAHGIRQAASAALAASPSETPALFGCGDAAAMIIDHLVQSS